MDHPPLTSVAEYKKTSTRYIKLLSRRSGQLAVMDVTSHVITIDERSMPNTLSIDKATPVSVRTYGVMRKKAKLYPPARSTALHNTYTNHNLISLYVADKFVDHCHTSEDLENKTYLYEYKPDNDTREPTSHIARHFICRCWSLHSKIAKRRSRCSLNRSSKSTIILGKLKQTKTCRKESFINNHHYY